MAASAPAARRALTRACLAALAARGVAGACATPGACAVEEDASLLQTSRTAALEGASMEAFLLAPKPGLRPGVLGGEAARQAAALLARERGVDPPEYLAVEVELPWEAMPAREPLAKCGATASKAASGSPEEHLAKAVTAFCDAGIGRFVEFYVDPKYQATYDRVRDKDGWIPRAYMTYYSTEDKNSTWSGQEDILIQSLSHFSDMPIVVINFGKLVPKSWSPERFPNMVLMHAPNSTLGPKTSFNLNKLTAMMFTKIRTGIQLDADQFANRGLDVMFKRAEEETTADYPYPVLPVHWMSRDKDSSDMAKWPEHYSWSSRCPDTPKQAYRWSHSHPTWTHFALPWIAKWASFVLAPKQTKAPEWIIQHGWWSDEPILNVGAWVDGASKQWCKFDIPSVWEFSNFMKQIGHVDMAKDSKYYPHGIAFMYFSAHDAKNPEESYKWMQRLWNMTEPDDKHMEVMYDGKWFPDGAALKKYDPKLKCLA